MKQTAPFRAIITQSIKDNLEALAQADGIQRGIFFSTSGALHFERVSATSQASWLFKTVHGQPFKWNEQ